MDDIKNAKCEMMADWLHSQQEESLWSTPGGFDEGVVLKVSQGLYTCSPAEIAEEGFFFKGIEALNVRVC